MMLVFNCIVSIHSTIQEMIVVDQNVVKTVVDQNVVKTKVIMTWS